MVRRGQITDRAWEQIEPLLPREGSKRGGQWRDHRTVINGILWKLRTADRPGATSQNCTVPGRPASTASTAGGATVPGIAS
jgi:transposase